ncbi:MAG: hypothetical protein RRA94_11880 [Bacteroidota bacterium]|nr:hypothetical protein [Bacteroidota bacterium]
MALLLSLFILLLSLAAIVLILGVCRASRQADDTVRRIMEPRLPREHAT